MKTRFTSLAILLTSVILVADCVFGYETRIEGLNVGSVDLVSAKEDGWAFAVRGERVSEGVCELTIGLTRPSEAVPPAFSVSFGLPQKDAHHKWTGGLENVTLPPEWGGHTESRLCSGLPVVSFVNDDDRNRILVAASDPKRKIGISAGLREEDCRLVWKVDFFGEPEAPLGSYSVKLRFDTRDVFFGTAIEEGVDWIERVSGMVLAVSPDVAFEPLYSSWYSFHQNVTDREIEAECAEAAKLGMKVLIVDDGWQTDDNNRGYAFCGDWEISKRRFPDMAAHVKNVHDLGMKYMVWFGVPMVGIKAKNFQRFTGKLLWVDTGRWSDYGCLDPRFPEVRAFLVGLYENAVREWDIDGLKLDFIDAIAIRGEDPAVKDGYKGRDIRSLPEAVDRLLKEIYARMTAIKPDFLIEFRQSYVGPGIRQYGNMLRAADCPGDLMANRCRTANLRLTSGRTAVHADMLEWNVAETAEDAARFVLSTIFSTIQYSVRLQTLPEDHRRMIRHWLGFSRDHREALLRGSFRPHHFEAMYPWIESENAQERIVAVYNASTVADAGAPDRPTFILNGTGKGMISLRLAGTPSRVDAFDTFGNPVPAPKLDKGIHDVRMPVSGLLKISYRK